MVEPLLLPKSAYSLTALRSAALAKKGCSILIDDVGDSWSVSFTGILSASMHAEFLRMTDEFSLRESLEAKFKNERDAIMSLAFGS